MATRSKANPLLRDRKPLGKRKKYNCADGPMAGQQIWLESVPSVIFTINGHTGRYIQSKDRKTAVQWQEENHG